MENLETNNLVPANLEPLPKSNKFLVILVIILLIIALGLAVILIFWDDLRPNKLLPQAKASFLVKVTRECQKLQEQIEIVKVITKTNKAIYVQANLNEDEIERLQSYDCVLGIYNHEEAQRELAMAKEQLGSELTEDIRSWKLKRTLVKKDLSDRDALKNYLQEKHQEISPEISPGQTGVISPYQLYVTPTEASVQSFSAGYNNNENLYLGAAQNWIWVSEQTLNGEAEKWLMPVEFLTQTPTYSTNPLPGKTVSDCSEQANTLASALRTSGVAATDVRVVLGEVNFEGTIGGHAWVELKQGNNWIVLDATSGPYYDDEAGQLVNQTPIPFDYFLYHEFPVIERWYYYNDQYFKDLSSGAGNAPTTWAAQATYSEPIKFQKEINLNPDKWQKIKKLFK